MHVCIYNRFLDFGVQNKFWVKSITYIRRYLMLAHTNFELYLYNVYIVFFKSVDENGQKLF